MESILNINKAPQIWVITVHAVETFDDDKHALELTASRGEDLFKIIEVVMNKAAAPRTRQQAAHDCAVVDRRITDDQVLRPRKLTDHTDIGGVTADENQGVCAVIVLGQQSLQRPVHRALAGNVSTSRRRDSISINRGFRGVDNFGMSIESEIVIAREVQKLSPIDLRSRAHAPLVHPEVRVLQS